MGLDKSMLIHRWRCDTSRALEVTPTLFKVSRTAWRRYYGLIVWLIELYSFSMQFFNHQVQIKHEYFCLLNHYKNILTKVLNLHCHWMEKGPTWLVALCGFLVLVLPHYVVCLQKAMIQLYWIITSIKTAACKLHLYTRLSMRRIACCKPKAEIG